LSLTERMPRSEACPKIVVVSVLPPMKILTVLELESKKEPRTMEGERTVKEAVPRRMRDPFTSKIVDGA